MTLYRRLHVASLCRCFFALRVQVFAQQQDPLIPAFSSFEIRYLSGRDQANPGNDSDTVEDLVCSESSSIQNCRWIVHEVELYSDENCSTQIDVMQVSGVPTADEHSYGSDMLLDENEATWWQSTQSCGFPENNSAYCHISFVVPMRALVQCVYILQERGVCATEMQFFRNNKLLKTGPILPVEGEEGSGD